MSKLVRKNKKIFALALVLGLTLTLVLFSWWLDQAPEAQAAIAINKKINYQGKLSTSASAAVTDGSYTMRFSIWDDATGGTRAWKEVWSATTTAGQVTVTNGIFSISLGTSTALTLDMMQNNYWLQVDLSTTAGASWTETFSPRKQLGATPYAFNADVVTGKATTTEATSTQSYVANFLKIASSTQPESGRVLSVGGASYFAGNVYTQGSATTTNSLRAAQIGIGTDPSSINILNVFGGTYLSGSATTTQYLNVGTAPNSTFSYNAGDIWASGGVTSTKSTTTVGYVADHLKVATTTEADGRKFVVSGKSYLAQAYSFDGDAVLAISAGSINTYTSFSYLSQLSKYGIYSSVTGGLSSGNDYAIYASAAGVGTDTNYGIYTTAGTGGGSNYALYTSGNTYLSGSATTTGTLDVQEYLWDSTGDLTVTDNLRVSGNATTSGYLVVGTLNPNSNLAAGTIWSTYATSSQATSTNLYTNSFGLGPDYLTDITGSGLTLSGGALTVTGQAPAGYAGAWQTLSGVGTAITPTSTTGIVVNAASSTITQLVVNQGTTTYATSTNLYSSTLGLNSEYFTDLTGTGLQNSAGVLSADFTKVAPFGYQGSWQLLANNVLTPTSTGAGIVVNAASSTITQLSVNYATSSNRLVLGTTQPTNDYGLLWAGGNTYTSGSATTTQYLTVGSAPTGVGYDAGDLNISDDLVVGGNATTSGYLVVGTTNPNSNLAAGTIWSTYATSSQATSTYLYTNSFALGPDNLTDITGSGLTLSGGALTVTGQAPAGYAGLWQTLSGTGTAITPTSTTGIVVNAASSTITQLSLNYATTSNRLVLGTTQPTNDFGSLWVGGNTYTSGSATTTGYLNVGTAPNSTFLYGAGDIWASGGVTSTAATSTTGYFADHLKVATTTEWDGGAKLYIGGNTYIAGSATTTNSLRVAQIGVGADPSGKNGINVNLSSGSPASATGAVGVNISVTDGSATTLTGAKVAISGVNNTSYGFYSSILSNGAPSQNIYGVFASTTIKGGQDTNNNAYGVYGSAAGDLSSTPLGRKYGIYAKASGVSGTGGFNYGIYTTATDATNNYAFYASGDTYLSGNATTTQNLTVAGALAVGTAAQPLATSTLRILNTNYSHTDGASASSSALFISTPTTTVAGAGLGPQSYFRSIYIQTPGPIASTTYGLYSEGNSYVSGSATTTGMLTVGQNLGIKLNTATSSAIALGGSQTIDVYSTTGNTTLTVDNGGSGTASLSVTNSLGVGYGPTGTAGQGVFSSAVAIGIGSVEFSSMFSVIGGISVFTNDQGTFSSFEDGAAVISVVAGVNKSKSIRATTIVSDNNTSYGIISRATASSDAEAATNAYGGYFTADVTIGALTNAYGLYTSASGASTNYAIYAAAGQSVFAGGSTTTNATSTISYVADHLKVATTTEADARFSAKLAVGGNVYISGSATTSGTMIISEKMGIATTTYADGRTLVVGGRVYVSSSVTAGSAGYFENPTNSTQPALVGSCSSNNNAGCSGVQGIFNGTGGSGGYGVYGINTNNTVGQNYGVYGISTSATFGNNFGVYGKAAGGYGVYSDGNLYAAGSATTTQYLNVGTAPDSTFGYNAGDIWASGGVTSTKATTTIGYVADHLKVATTTEWDGSKALIVGGQAVINRTITSGTSTALLVVSNNFSEAVNGNDSVGIEVSAIASSLKQDDSAYGIKMINVSGGDYNYGIYINYSTPNIHDNIGVYSAVINPLNDAYISNAIGIQASSTVANNSFSAVNYSYGLYASGRNENTVAGSTAYGVYATAGGNASNQYALYASGNTYTSGSATTTGYLNVGTAPNSTFLYGAGDIWASGGVTSTKATSTISYVADHLKVATTTEADARFSAKLAVGGNVYISGSATTTGSLLIGNVSGTAGQLAIGTQPSSTAALGIAITGVDKAYGTYATSSYSELTNDNALSRVNYGGYFSSRITMRTAAVGQTGVSYGVYGSSSGGGNVGAGDLPDITSYGLYGSATASDGGASWTATNYGVYGTASGGTNNYAAYFSGNTYLNGGATVTPYLMVGSGGTVNNLNYAGGDLYVQNDVEIDGKLFSNLTSYSGATSPVCWNAITQELTQNGASGCSAASPFLISLDGVPLAEVLANQWKVEASSINRIDGYDGISPAGFVLGSYKSKETDYIDSISLQLRCEQDQVITTKEYPLTFIGKLDQAVKANWLDAVSAQDGTYFQSREGDNNLVVFTQPQPEDWANCQSHTFAFKAFGYYEWEKPEFTPEQVESFWETYSQYKFEPITLLQEIISTALNFVAKLFGLEGSTTPPVNSTPPENDGVVQGGQQPLPVTDQPISETTTILPVIDGQATSTNQESGEEQPAESTPTEVVSEIILPPSETAPAVENPPVTEATPPPAEPAGE